MSDEGSKPCAGGARPIAGCLPDWPSPLQDNLLTSRPYFLLPLGIAADDATRGVAEDQCKILEEVAVAIEKEDATDLFILSHGWHRNLLAGVAAYDRLVSRFFGLLARGRLQGAAERRPVFVAVHWNSDPEKDSWVDRSGRRDKDSFLNLTKRLFAPRPANPSMAERVAAKQYAHPNLADPNRGFETYGLGVLTDDMEDMFEAMSKVSAGDSPDPHVSDATWKELLLRLEQYDIRGFEYSAGSPEKAASVWRAYFEAKNKRFLTDQLETPRAVSWFIPTFVTFISFLIPIIGIGGLLAAAKALFTKSLNGWTLYPPNAFRDFGQPLHRLHLPPYAQDFWVGAVLVLAGTFAIALLWLAAGRRTGLYPIQIVIWLPILLVVAVPLLVYLLLTYLLRTGFALAGVVLMFLGWYALGTYVLGVCAIFGLVASILDWKLNGVFREKVVPGEGGSKSLREYLAMPSRWVLAGLRKCVTEDSPGFKIASTLDNQLAFFEMQRLGTDAGEELGDWLNCLESRLKEKANPEWLKVARVRVHLVGHSFGGLVVANALRAWVRERLVTTGAIPSKRARRTLGMYIASKQPQPTLEQGGFLLQGHTCCLIQGAIASDWYRFEEPAISMLNGSLSSILSAYDTANGVWYPLANSGRLSAGFVGLSKLGKDRRPAIDIGKQGEFALLVKPPNIGEAINHARGDTLTSPDCATTWPCPLLLNIDASRIIYEGSVATGGGHDDIFKDDVVNLIWAVCSVQGRAT